MSAYSDLILAEPALQSYWRLNEALDSTTVADSKGSFTGTVGGGAGSVTFGNPSLLLSDNDTCAGFPVVGLNQGIDFSASAYHFLGTVNYTIEAWIRPTASALSNNGFIVCNATATDGWGFRILAAGGIRTHREVANVLVTCESATGLIVAGTTYHTAATYDGTTMLCYINGVQVATAAHSTSLTDPGIALMIGSFSSAGGNKFNDGFIDEVAIYNDDLSAPTLLAHYDAGIASPSGPAAEKIRIVRSNLRW